MDHDIVIAPVLIGGRLLNFTNIPPVAKKQIDRITNKRYLVSLFLVIFM